VARFSALEAAGWSFTWAIGVAMGVALGAYLTVLGAAATPGTVVLDSTELLHLPAIAGGVVFVVSFLGRAIIAAARGIPPARKSNSGDGAEHYSDRDSVA
jgi:hypothetical protein